MALGGREVEGPEDHPLDPFGPLCKLISLRLKLALNHTPTGFIQYILGQVSESGLMGYINWISLYFSGSIKGFKPTHILS